MKAVFAHDHKLIRAKDGTRVFSHGNLPYSVLTRYLKHVDELLVVGRLGGSADCESLTAASGPGVGFRLLPGLLTPRSFLGGHRRIHRELESIVKDTDAVVARVPSVMGRMAAKIARRLGKPFALEVVGCAWGGWWNHGSLSGKLYAPLAFLETREIVSLSERTLYVTEHFLQRRYPCASVGIACSDVELAAAGADVMERRMRRLSAVRQGPFRLGLIGSLSTATKGFAVVLKALAMLRRAGTPELVLDILGGGDATQWRCLGADLGVSQQVRFRGTVPSGQPVFDWLDSVDLYIQPSFQEGLPRSLVEAMSRGCPALGSTAGGIPELLAGDCLHKPGDAKTLSRQIEHAVQSADWRVGQAVRNFEVAERYERARLDAIRDEFWGEFFLSAKAGCGRPLQKGQEMLPGLTSLTTSVQ